MKYRISGAAALISAAFFAMSPLHAEDVTAQTVVATINGTQITVGHLIAARQSLPPQYQSLTDEQLYDGILNQIVQQEILKQSAGEIGEALKYQIENEERVVIAGSMLETIAKEAVNDASLKAAYDAKFAEFEPGREYHAAHILVETEDEAKALIADLDAGADFADLAREKSTGPSGPNGGDLGWFGLGMMVPEFEQVVVGMEEGTVSVPVQTQFGWHVIKLMETRLSEVPPLADVQDELAAEIQDKAIQDKIASLESDGAVERVDGIDPSVLRMDDLLAN
ncbi:MAG: peptidylprolyl isomerase [Alphaproteobacteria bacterium]|nr:peptidylprolyl isomerase [Alphaproteobacteria bacterium]MBU1278489.1 peptidylprolyl isomerase [Alphaproteobacteria bacterium]MBU1574671.1 peptidylprolyl isomerase [Alphaproteobacteria bacterium]MBU1828000.1 peptidylprolyl isomerase [Alphaproteobacteria bacterium]MBU2076994.1 peptidylprolyl isomerase [Alphaproteobacteria bacterium]